MSVIVLYRDLFCSPVSEVCLTASLLYAIKVYKNALEKQGGGETCIRFLCFEMSPLLDKLILLGC